MPNWVYNTLRVKGTKKRLTQFAWAIGSPEAPLDWTRLATVIPMTWDSRDERRAGELEVDGRDLVYRFDTAWNPRPQMVEDLSSQYPDLGFELHYVEEGPAFAGAAVFAQGRKIGEAYLGDGEEQAFFEPYGEDEYDGEWDYDGMTASLLERARAGEVIDWDARRKRAQQAREEAEEQAAVEEGDRLNEAVHRIRRDPALRQDVQSRNEILIPLAGRTGPGLSAIPKAWWNDDLLVAFLLEQYQQATLIPASLCTESLVDKLLAVEGRGYAGIYPISKLKVGLRNERQALAYVKRSPGSLKSVPRPLRTAPVCEQAVQGDGKALEHVPKALRTAALCEAAVAQDGAALAFVPPALKTAEMCRKAVHPETPNVLKFVPAKFLDEALLKVALDNTHSWNTLELDSVNSAALRRKYLVPIITKSGWSSVKVMTEEEHERAWGSPEGQALLCKLLEDDSIGLLDKVPPRFHTPEVLTAAGQHSPMANFAFIPDTYKTRKLCREALEGDFWGGNSLVHIPVQLRDRSLCALALDKSLTGFASKYRTDDFTRELSIWQAKFEQEKENRKDKEDTGIRPAASARAYVSSCFVESKFPDSVWDAELAARSLDSSPYAVLFVPRRFVTEQALVEVVRGCFGLYLVLEDAVARELALQAAAILRDFVGEKAWHLSSKLQGLQRFLSPSASEQLTELLQAFAVRWIKTRMYADVLAKELGNSETVVKGLVSTGKTPEMFPEWIDRTALSADEIHRILFAD